MTKQQEVVPALELLLFIYSSTRVIFPVDLDLGTEAVHGKAPGRVTLVKRGDNRVTRLRDVQDEGVSVSSAGCCHLHGFG